MTIVKKVSVYPKMRSGEFKGRVHGTYRFKEVQEDGHLVLELDPTYSPQQMLIPVDMLNENGIKWVRFGKTGERLKCCPRDEHGEEIPSEEWTEEQREKVKECVRGIEPTYHLNSFASSTSADNVCTLASTYDGLTIFYKVEKG